MSRPRSLPARDPVYGALRAASSPMTAYQILDAVRDHGITAPPTVYRALNRLVDEGLAHRVESLNAYVACSHEQHREGVAVLAICDNCGAVSELDAPRAVSELMEAASGRRFLAQRMTVELRGLCANCNVGAEAAVAEHDHHHGHDHD